MTIYYTAGPAITIAFKVPYKNASCDLIIKSDIPFEKFLTQAAQKMETSVLHLTQIGYILPWKAPRTGKPVAKLLEDKESWETLIQNIFVYIDEQKAKNCGRGHVKPFSIQIVDTSEVVETSSKVFYFS
jgi:hypothetical protein